VRQLEVVDRLLDASALLGCDVPGRCARICTRSDRGVLAGRVRERLSQGLPHVALEVLPLDSTYYDGVRVLLDATAASGGRVNLSDTGVFDWMGRLTSNRKLRFVASGCGLPLLLLLFPAASRTTLPTAGSPRRSP